MSARPPRAVLRASLGAAVLAGLAAGAVRGDVVTFANGKSIRATAFRVAGRVRVNPYRSTLPGMTWGVIEHPPADIRSVAPEEGSGDLLGALEALAPGDVAGRKALLAQATRAKEKTVARRVAEEILALDPAHAPALESVGGPEAWTARRRGDPRLDAALASEVRRLLRLSSGKDRRAAAESLVAARGLSLAPEAIERMARALREERGERPPTAVRVEAAKRPGGSYAAFVPFETDPLVARPLLLALHGGGGSDAKSDVVVGSGKEALSLFVEGARRAGVIVVAPTALEWPWTTPANEAYLQAVLEEAAIRWNVDLDRVHVAGQGDGADAALWFASRHAAQFATVGAAGARPGLPASIAARGVGVWLYHGEADEVVPVDEARKVALALRKADADFVYCELPTLGRGFPPQAEGDYWHFAAPRRRPRARSAWPRGSFSEPATPAEVAAFGPPAGAWSPEVSAPLDALRRGLSESEPAARTLLREPSEGLAAAAGAIVADRSVPTEGRAWAAWLLGERRDPAGLDPLADAVRAETDAWLLGFVARAIRGIGSPDATEDLRSALTDVADRYRRRIWPGGAVPFFEYDRTCRLAADLVEALGTVAPSGDVAVDLERAAVVGILRDGRKVAGNLPAGEDPSASRARLAEALGRAYRALAAEPTLLDMLRVSLRLDPVAAAAAARGATEGLRRPK